MTIYNLSLSDNVAFSDKRTVDEALAYVSTLMTGILAFWNFDEGSQASNVSFADATGNLHTLALSNTALTYSPVSGVVNNGIDMSQWGSVTFNSITLSNSGHKFSLSFWFKCSTLSTFQLSFNYTDGSSIAHTITILPDNVQLQYMTAIRIVDDTNSGSNVYSFNCRNLVANVWNHIVLEYDYLGNIFTMYANGAGLGSDTSGSTFPHWVYDFTDFQLQDAIKYDAIGWWTKALSISEITSLYKNGNGIQYPFKDQSIIDQIGFNELARQNLYKVSVLDTVTMSESNNAWLMHQFTNDLITFTEIASGNTLHYFPTDTITFTDRNSAQTDIVPSSLATSLASYWKLDESNQSAPSSFADSVGSNILHASLGYTASAGLINNGFESAQFGTSTNFIGLTLGTGNLYTVNFWAKDYFSFNLGDSYTGEFLRFYYVVASNNLAIDYNDGTGNKTTTIPLPSGFNINNWNMYTIEYERSTTPYSFGVYLNGVSASWGGTQPIADAFNELNLGNQGSTVYYDEVGFWDRLLTQGELTLLYDNGYGVAYPFNAHEMADYIGFNETVYSNIKAGIATDVVLFSDTPVNHGTMRDTVSDTITFTDTANTNFVALQKLYDLVTFTDTVSSSTPWHEAMTDTVTFSDSVNDHLFVLKLADTVYFFDFAQARDGTFRELVSDIISFTDSIIIGQPKHVTASDTITFNDSISHSSPYHAVAGPDIVSFSDKVVFAGPVYAAASDTITFKEQWTQFHQLSIVDTLILTDKVKPSSKVYATASDSILFSEALIERGPLKESVSDTITLTDKMVLNGIYNFSIIDCILFNEKGAKAVPASVTDTITLTDAAVNVKYFTLSDKVIFSEVFSIPNFNFTEFPCERDVLHLNMPLLKETIKFTDSVSLSGSGYSTPASDTLLFRDGAVGFKINVNGR